MTDRPYFIRTLPTTDRGPTSTTTVEWHLKVKDTECNVSLAKQPACKKSAQDINSFKDKAYFRVSWTKSPHPFLTMPTQKSLK